MEKATEAREKNDQGAELDAINLAVVNSIASDLTGLVNTTALKQGLTGLVKGNLDTIIDSTKTEWEVEGNTGRLYKINNRGNVEIASTVNITKDGEIATELSYNSDEIELNTTTIQLNATPTPDLTINSVTWESGTPTVASIDNTGLVTLKDKGSTTITLTANTSGGNFTKNCTISITKPLEIGDSVNYSTTINNQTLSNWKVFYKETIGTTEYTYIILEGYLPYNAISSTLISNYSLAQGSTGTPSYCVKNTSNRAKLINAMKDTYWKSLLVENKNNTTDNHGSMIDINIKAMGSPDLELWQKSWNAKHLTTSDQLFINKQASAMSDGLYGYYVNKGSAPGTSDYVTTMSNQEKLWFPYRANEQNCGGYWLASPNANQGDRVFYVGYNGRLYDGYYANNAGFAFRPVICLPSSVFE